MASSKRTRAKNKFNASILRQQNHCSVSRVKVFRSNKHIEALFINNDNVCQYSIKSNDPSLKLKSGSNKDAAFKIGKEIAKWLTKEKLISEKIVFDRNGFIYHGRVAEVARGLRESGVEI